MGVLEKAGDAAKGLWMRFALRGVRYSDDYARLDSAYRVPDPWRLGSEAERYRFEQTNRIIVREFGRVGSLLEVGCGEGHQTRRLREVCERVHGIDVSPRAIERARAGCPGAAFSTCDLFSPDLAAGGRRFDLVVACEVLYYMRDVPAAVRRMGELGKGCLVTYFDGEMAALDARLPALNGAGSAVFGSGGTEWKAVWWRDEKV
ncbi:MAG: SAM-dependent methyltransferase [Elusimicrobiota bacterium]